MIGILAGLSNSPINRLVVNDIGPDQAVLRIGKYVRDAPDSFPTTEAAQAYFRNVLSPFGKLEDWQWRHLSDPASDLTDKVDIAYTTTGD